MLVKVFSARRVAVVLVAAGVAFMVSPSLATTNGTNPVFDNTMSEPRLNTINDMNSTGLQVGHINAGLNESFTERAEDLNPIGPFLVENDANVCWGSDDPNVCYLAYCGEYDVAAYAPGWTSYEIAPNGYVDARVTYLTWKYGIEFYKDNRESGAALATVVAVQALVWAWHSDPVHGTAVFSGVAAPYNDPLNWDGLTPSAHDDPSPRVGFWGPDPIDLIEEASGFYPGTDTDALEDSTQKVYDLAVEATAKAGPWSLEQGPGENVATYVVLSGANGPIEGETVTFTTNTGDVEVVTDANGHAAWPADASTAAVEAPGDTYIGDSTLAYPGADIQDLLVTFGQLLQVQFTDTPATPTTTTTTTTTTTAAPTTTTTIVVEAPEQTTTTTTPATTTTVVVSPPDVSPPAEPEPENPTFTG